jgi:hypothetical protein
VQVADELPNQHPDVIDVLLNGLRGQVRRGQVFEEGPELSP